MIVLINFLLGLISVNAITNPQFGVDPREILATVEFFVVPFAFFE